MPKNFVKTKQCLWVTLLKSVNGAVTFLTGCCGYRALLPLFEVALKSRSSKSLFEVSDFEANSKKAALRSLRFRRKPLFEVALRSLRLRRKLLEECLARCPSHLLFKH